MNYYEHHIGDYAEATAHLSILEDGAYSRLLRKVYATERPLPADIIRVQRLIGARTDEECVAVESVLSEFFDLREDGWHQSRCDQSIAAYQAGEPERRVKKTNEAARQHRHRAERATLFKSLHDAGMYPAWNTPMVEVRALIAKLPYESVLEPVTERVTGPATLPVTTTETLATATQHPIPSPHLPDPNIQSPVPMPFGKKSRQSRIPDHFSPNEAGIAAAEGLLLERELDAFRNHHVAKGSSMADWQAAWRTWCSNAHKFSKSLYSVARSKPASKHAGFQQLDYHKGIAENGSFV